MLQFISGLESQFPSLTAALQVIANQIATAAGVAPITITAPSVPAPKTTAPKTTIPAPVISTPAKAHHVNGIGVKQYYASGTLNAIRGLGVVGERGPEILNFRGGEQVIPTTAAPSWEMWPLLPPPDPDIADLVDRDGVTRLASATRVRQR